MSIGLQYLFTVLTTLGLPLYFFTRGMITFMVTHTSGHAAHTQTNPEPIETASKHIIIAAAITNNAISVPLIVLAIP